MARGAKLVLFILAVIFVAILVGYSPPFAGPEYDMVRVGLLFVGVNFLVGIVMLISLGEWSD
ncbi:MAG: hypothetical protein HXY34_05920 [Candidatus Thorarchaeota archaeon]|nr:hypothetical protein [Candidatus Thorarchaeota archaeon]